MTQSRDPLEMALDALRAVPPPAQQNQHRAAFLAEAERLRVSSVPAMRLEEMNGDHTKEERRMKANKLRRNLLLVAILAALLVAGGVLAQEIIEFFTQGEDDTTTFEVYPVDGEIVTVNTPSPIEDAGFEVWMPSYIPDAYVLERSEYYSGGGTTLTYRCGDVWAFSINQRPVAPEDVPDIRSEVGASAVIETVPIGEVIGQYVRGHWVTPPSQMPDSDAAPGTPISVPGIWTNFSSWQQLVWYEDAFLYKISTSGGLTNSIAFPPCSLSKGDYVAIANSLQPASRLSE
jgi:hypothetical protein